MAESLVDTKWVIDKLDSSNWTTWKFQMRHLLFTKGFWRLINGMEVLAESASAQVQTKFLRKSQRAISTIVLAISTQQAYLVTCKWP